MKPKLNIVKIGGAIVEDAHELDKFLRLFAAWDGFKILVHGGGKKASKMMERMGMVPKMHEGRRITDANALEVAVMVYGGTSNTEITARLQALACNAIGMSGADGNAILATKRPVQEVDYGFAGDIVAVNQDLVAQFLTLGLYPVFCALTHDNKGQLLNTNADTIASALAIALSSQYEVLLTYCFELDGVLQDLENKGSLIFKIDSRSYKDLKKSGVISEGMLPKLQNCFNALENGVSEVRLGNVGAVNNESNYYTRIVL